MPVNEQVWLLPQASDCVEQEDDEHPPLNAPHVPAEQVRCGVPL
jgi:hypothetical protein